MPTGFRSESIAQNTTPSAPKVGHEPRHRHYVSLIPMGWDGMGGEGRGEEGRGGEGRGGGRACATVK